MIKLENVTKKYGDLTVFNNFSLEFKSGEVTAVLGASGVGKTTILNLLAGITDYSAGKVYTENAVSYVFQSPNLVENLSVYKNAEMVLKSVYRDKEKREKIICDLLKAADVFDKKDSPVFSLSGGQKQRAGIVRAFCYPSKLMLMDEPFSSLDISLKVRLIDLYARLLSENPRTVIFVSHSESEAVALADRIIVLGNNEIEADFYVDDLSENNEANGENFKAKTKCAKPRDESSENSVSARKKILNCFKNL